MKAKSPIIIALSGGKATSFNCSYYTFMTTTLSWPYTHTWIFLIFKYIQTPKHYSSSLHFQNTTLPLQSPNISKHKNPSILGNHCERFQQPQTPWIHTCTDGHTHKPVHTPGHKDNSPMYHIWIHIKPLESPKGHISNLHTPKYSHRTIPHTSSTNTILPLFCVHITPLLH